MTGPALDGPPVLFADLDSTVRHGKDELGRFVEHPDDVVIFPEALDRIRAWRERGGIVVGVTNQAGVAYGYIDQPTHRAIMRRTIVDAGLDHAVACTHAATAGCWCRKPEAGLLWQAIAWVNQTRLVIPPRSACLMVGDRPEDEQAAAAGGVTCLDTETWRAGTWDGGDGA